MPLPYETPEDAFRRVFLFLMPRVTKDLKTIVVVPLTTLVGGAALVGAVQRLAAGARLAALPRAVHVAGGARAALARVRTRELVAGHVDHIADCATA